MPEFKGGYVINPEAFWRPAYRISPFNTSFVARNRRIVEEGRTDEALIRSVFGPDYMPCGSGKQAIFHALQQYALHPEDEVWIVTTSGNRYISGCVTREIEKCCKWSRQRSERTKLIFVNHEFGFCAAELRSLKETGLPLIEDRALSFASTDAGGDTGKLGDFVIYSLPKFFPLSFGGVLQCNNPSRLVRPVAPDPALEVAFRPLMTHYLPGVEAISGKRRAAFRHLSDAFGSLGFRPRFEPGAGEVPGVFLFRAPGLDLDRFKIFMQENGIESSVFYGEEAFFIPVHQELVPEDLDFFFTLTQYFLEHGTK